MFCSSCIVINGSVGGMLTVCIWRYSGLVCGFISLVICCDKLMVKYLVDLCCIIIMFELEMIVIVDCKSLLMFFG